MSGFGADSEAKAGRTERARKVVNVSSISGLFGEATQFSYSAAIGLFNSVLNLILLVTFNFVAKKANQSSLW